MDLWRTPPRDISRRRLPIAGSALDLCQDRGKRTALALITRTLFSSLSKPSFVKTGKVLQPVRDQQSIEIFLVDACGRLLEPMEDLGRASLRTSRSSPDVCGIRAWASIVATEKMFPARRTVSEAVNSPSLIVNRVFSSEIRLKRPRKRHGPSWREPPWTGESPPPGGRDARSFGHPKYSYLQPDCASEIDDLRLIGASSSDNARWTVMSLVTQESPVREQARLESLTPWRLCKAAASQILMASRSIWRLLTPWDEAHSHPFPVVLFGVGIR
jgi:hypothetical protein